MIQKSSTLWTHVATAATTPLFAIDLKTGAVTSAAFDTTARSYLSKLMWQFLGSMELSQRAAAVPNLVPRIIAVSSLTGTGELRVEVSGTTASVSIGNATIGETVLVQIPHSVGLPLFPKIIDPSPNEIFVYRKETLGDASTGLYYVTVAARGEDQAAVDAIVIEKNLDFSTPGTVGTFALDIHGALGLFIHSVTVTTYTRVETQAKMAVVIDNPQGPVKPHEAVRPSATLISGNGSQLSTPTVVLTGPDGAVPATNGIPHQLDPDATYDHIRVSAVGFAQATANVVSDTAYNKAQSLVIQF
jgi:hypothetical protein